MKPAKLLLFVMLFAMACSEKEENPGDFGEIQIPDVGQLDQTIGLEGTEKPASITFRTADAWTSTIVQTRADAPTGSPSRPITAIRQEAIRYKSM